MIANVSATMAGMSGISSGLLFSLQTAVGPVKTATCTFVPNIITESHSTADILERDDDNKLSVIQTDSVTNAGKHKPSKTQSLPNLELYPKNYEPEFLFYIRKMVSLVNTNRIIAFCQS